MDDKSRLTLLNDRLNERRLTWTKADYEMMTGKATPRGRMLGFLTPGYRGKDKLWQSGRICYGYCYKTYTDRDFTRPYLAWVIFSPMSSFEENPLLYESIIQKLQPLMDTKKPDRQLHKFFHALTNPVTEPKYFPIHEHYCDGKLVYVSTTYVFPELTSQLKLGIIPIIIAPGVTKEIMCVPDGLLKDQTLLF